MLLQNFQHATSFLLGSNFEILLYVPVMKLDAASVGVACRGRAQICCWGWGGKVFLIELYTYISVYVCVCVSVSEKYHVFWERCKPTPFEDYWFNISWVSYVHVLFFINNFLTLWVLIRYLSFIKLRIKFNSNLSYKIENFKD